MINKFKEYFSSLYLAPSVCVCVCVCACMCVRENRQPEPEAETKTKRGREEQGGGDKRGNKEAEIAWILSLYNHHTAHSHCAIGQHCGLKVVIY